MKERTVQLSAIMFGRCSPGPAAIWTGFGRNNQAARIGFKNNGLLRFLVEGDKRVSRQYGVFPVNPVRRPHLDAAAGRRFIEWLTLSPGRTAIGKNRADRDQPSHPNAAGEGS